VFYYLERAEVCLVPMALVNSILPGDADNIAGFSHNVFCLYTGCQDVRLVPYEFVAVSHDSCGFESRAW